MHSPRDETVFHPLERNKLLLPYLRQIFLHNLLDDDVVEGRKVCFGSIFQLRYGFDASGAHAENDVRNELARLVRAHVSRRSDLSSKGNGMSERSEESNE